MVFFSGQGFIKRIIKMRYLQQCNLVSQCVFFKSHCLNMTWFFFFYKSKNMSDMNVFANEFLQIR